jgi:lipid A 3-O-deacylase
MNTKPKTSLRSALLLTLLLSAGLAQAQPKRHVPYKQAAIFGSVFTWIYAGAIGAPFRNCESVGNNVRLEYGVDEELNVKTVGFFNQDCTLQELETWRLSYKPMLNLSQWSGDSSSEFARSAYDVAVIPMIRWEKSFDFTPKLLDFEMGVGASYVSETNIGSRKKSTNFQFTDHFGVGISSPKHDWRVSFAFRHLSNSSIKLPNNGVNLFGAAVEFKLK